MIGTPSVGIALRASIDSRNHVPVHSNYFFLILSILKSNIYHEQRTRLFAWDLMKIDGSVQSLDRLGRRGGMRDDSAEILFQSFLQEALVSSSDRGRAVHSLVFVHPTTFPLPTTASPTLQVAVERLLWRVTRRSNESFRLSTVARRGPCGPIRKLTLLCTRSLVWCSKYKVRRSFLTRSVSKAWIAFVRW